MKTKKILAGFLALLAGAVFTQQIFAEGGPPVEGGGPGGGPAAERTIKPETQDNHLQEILRAPEGGTEDGPTAGGKEIYIDGLSGPGDASPDAAGDQWNALHAADCLNGRESIPADIGIVTRSSFFQVLLDPNMGGAFPGMKKGEPKTLQIPKGEEAPLAENIPYCLRSDKFSDIGGMVLSYNFLGWMEEETGQKIPAGESYIPEGDVTLLALWEPDNGKYTVTLEPDERDHSREAVEAHGIPGNSVIWDLPEWSLAGHAPVDWEVEAAGEKASWEKGKTKITADTVLRPLYDVEEIKIIFRAGNGAEDVPQIIVKGECVLPPSPAPLWEGHRFLYWADTEGAFDFAIPPEADLTLTGVWEQIPQASGGADSEDDFTRNDEPATSTSSGGSGGEKPLLGSRDRNSAASFRLDNDGRIGVSRMAELIRRNAAADVVLQGNRFAFRFRKGTMRQVPGKETYDFGASFTLEDRARIEEAAGPALALAVHYNYSGELPAQAEITINVGKEYAGQTLYYYYFNPETSALEFVQSAMVDGEGNVTVRQTHCSDYAFLTVNLYESAAATAAEKENPPVADDHRTRRKLPDAGQPIPWRLAVLGGAFAALSLFYLKKGSLKN